MLKHEHRLEVIATETEIKSDQIAKGDWAARVRISTNLGELEITKNVFLFNIGYLILNF